MKTNRKEGIDYGFIDFTRVHSDGTRTGATFVWHKGSDVVQVLGGISHNTGILITPELLDQLKKRCTP